MPNQLTSESMNGIECNLLAGSNNRNFGYMERRKMPNEIRSSPIGTHDHFREAYVQTRGRTQDNIDPNWVEFSTFESCYHTKVPNPSKGIVLRQEIDAHPSFRVISHSCRTDTLEFRRYPSGTGPQAAGSPWDRAAYEPDEAPTPCLVCLEGDIGSFPVTIVHFGPDVLYVIPRV